MPVILRFDHYSDEEKQSPTSQFVDQRRNQPVYDSYESYFEMDMRDIQEQTVDLYPLFTNEEYYEEISHPEPAENAKKQTKEKSLPTRPVYDDDESDPWEIHEGEPEEQHKWKFISGPEPISEQPSFGTS